MTFFFYTDFPLLIHNLLFSVLIKFEHWFNWKCDNVIIYKNRWWIDYIQKKE